MPATHGAEIDQFAAQLVADIPQVALRNLPEVGRFSNLHE